MKSVDSDIVVERFIVGPLDVNCYLLWSRTHRTAFVIDPGGDAEVIEDGVKKHGLSVKYIINTHGHFDHIGADVELKESLGASLVIHKDDALLLQRGSEQAMVFNIHVPSQPPPDLLVEDGSLLEADGLVLEVIHTPGHTPGGISLYLREEKILFTGDTLFAGGVGRTDLPGGSYELLLDSIKRRILTLDDSTRILPGHGPYSTIGEEKAINPFLMESETPG